MEDKKNKQTESHEPSQNTMSRVSTRAALSKRNIENEEVEP